MPDGYVTIATYSTPLEADLSRLKLESEDIPVFILDSHVGAMNSIYGIAAGVRIQVPEEFVEQSLDVLKNSPEPELLGKDLFGDDDEDETNEYGEYLSECPKCSSQKIGRYDYVFTIVGYVFYGIIRIVTFRKIFPVKYSWYCKECKELWKAPQKVV